MLGNPGKKYEKTRHNAGWQAVDFLVGKNAQWQKDKKTNAEIFKTDPPARLEQANACDGGRGDKIFVKPQTFMNESGKAVRALADYYKIPAKNITVIYDELDLPFGEIRVRKNGGSAGHNGIKSIIQHLGTEDFWRVRIGIKNQPNKINSLLKIKIPAERYVLKKFSQGELKELEKNIFPKILEEVEKIV